MAGYLPVKPSSDFIEIEKLFFQMCEVNSVELFCIETNNFLVYKLEEKDDSFTMIGILPYANANLTSICEIIGEFKKQYCLHIGLENLKT